MNQNSEKKESASTTTNEKDKIARPVKVPAPLKFYPDRVTIELYVIETGKRLSVIYLSQTKTLGLIKDHIRKNNEANMLKTLLIKKE